MPEKLIVLSFLTTMIIMILFRGSRTEWDVHQDMQEDHEAQHGEAERQAYEEFEHKAACSDKTCSYCWPQSV